MKKKDDEALSLKLLELFTKYTIEESNISLKFIENQINFYEKERDYLLENKPFKFQKKKMKGYNIKLDEVQQKIIKLYKDYAEEMEILTKLCEPISKDTKPIKKKKIA